jgi:hypothetical protein
VKNLREELREATRTAKLNGQKILSVCGEAPAEEALFRDDERMMLLRCLTRCAFPIQTKVWSLVSQANLTVIHKNSNFPYLVKEALASGEF